MDDGSKLNYRRKLVESEFQFAGRAKVLATPLTTSLGFADRIGVIYGQTTPSQSGVDVVGEITDDYAVNVYFEELDLAVWFGERVLELVEAAPEIKTTLIDGFIRVETVERKKDA